jgi:UDP-2-acetamido-2-deoxy-ribo-hexuluronate aminotransferase
MTVAFYENRREIETILNRAALDFAAMIRQENFLNGAQVVAFEDAMRVWTGSAHAVAVGNATDALIISLRAAGIGPGDEVIVPAYSFFATASSVAHAGATPVFVDIEPETYAIDARLTEAAITPRTRAIMPVHLFCQMADMPRLASLAAANDLVLIEDSAEAIGMSQQGVHAGRFGKAGVFSFFPTKTLGALGDAGMIVTDDAVFARDCRSLADLGRDAASIATMPGIASRMDDWHAIVLRHRLEILNEAIAARRRHAERLTRRLAALPEVATPRFHGRGYDASPVWYVYLMEAPYRDGLARYLAGRGITTETYYPLPLHLQPVFHRLGYEPGDCPVAEAAAARALGLPMHAELTDAQIDAVADAIADFFMETRHDD